MGVVLSRGRTLDVLEVHIGNGHAALYDPNNIRLALPQIRQTPRICGYDVRDTHCTE